MNLRIKQIDISYFKGVRNLHLDCDGKIVNISGKNGTGKTTISDAIQWCLFGKNTEGDTKFGVKTLDANGEVIANVEHSVQLMIEVMGEDSIVKTVTIKRVWVEDRQTSRGRQTDEIKNHAEFYVNGEKFSKKDFDAYMASMVNEATFRAATNPSYFFTLKWQDQREMLKNMVGEISYGRLNNEYADVLNRLREHENIEGYLKHLAYNIKLVKEKMEEIPSRIDEQRQTMPERLDFAQIEETLQLKQKELNNVRDNIAAVKQGDKSASSTVLRDKINFCRRRIDNMVIGARSRARELRGDYDAQVKQAGRDKLEAENLKIELTSKCNSLRVCISRCTIALADIDKEIMSFREAWNNAVANKPVTVDECCPYCGSPYSEDKKHEIMAEVMRKANIERAEKKAALQKLAEDLKRRKAEAEAEKKANEEILAATEEKLERANKNAEIVKASYDEISSKELQSEEDILAENVNYKEACDELAQLERQAEETIVTDNHEALLNLEFALNKLTDETKELSMQLATRATLQAHLDRIDELEKENEILSRQLDGYMIQDDMAREYEQKCNEMWEEEVNKLFEDVEFRLFEQLNDGTRKANCRCTINGVNYADANRAAQINAGLDVLNAISRYYNVVAPVVIDNAEAINNIRHTSGQQFRFYVNNADGLTLTIN